MEQKEKDFSDLVKTHKGSIYSVCMMFSESEADVEDLFQEVLINLWRGLETFRGDSSPATWIWRVSLNTCLSWERGRKRRKQLQLDLQHNYFSNSKEEDRQIRMLHQRISRLRPFDRAIVLLWLENLPYEEIASIVGISVKNVSIRLYRIKETLKQMSNLSPEKK